MVCRFVFRKGILNITNRMQPILQHHIEPGIAKYKGKEDGYLQVLLDTANMQYTPYVFEDGRIMLVNPKREFGLLYDSEEELLEGIKNKA